MDDAQQIREEQTAIWNGPGGRAWVDLQPTLDGMFQPFADRLADAAAVRAAEHGGAQVLDVGCGAGSTTFAIARRLGASGACVGLDISEPLIAAARAHAEQEGTSARFVCADAQTYAFEPGAFDMIVSRFGVMFFADFVEAFVNLRRAARSGAGLLFVAWRSMDENPFMTAAERAARPLLPDMPARQPNAPGQFAFADADRVRVLLEESGWRAIDIRPVDVVCTLPEAELRTYLTRLGPVGLLLKDADEPTRARVTEAVNAAFDTYVSGGEARFTAACWEVAARAP